MDYGLIACWTICSILACGNIACWIVVFRSKLVWKSNGHEIHIGGVQETQKIVEELKKENADFKKENLEFRNEIAELRKILWKYLEGGNKKKK